MSLQYIKLLRPRQPFERRFPRPRFGERPEGFFVDQNDRPPDLGVMRPRLCIVVLMEPARKVVGRAYIEGIIGTAEDVGVEHCANNT